MSQSPLFALFCTVQVDANFLNGLLHAAYSRNAQNFPGARSIYFMVDQNIPPQGTLATEQVNSVGSFPFKGQDAQSLADFLRNLHGTSSALSVDDFLVVDSRTQQNQGVLHVHASGAPQALRMVRLSAESANDVPVAIDSGTLGFDEVQEAVGEDGVFCEK